MLDNRRRLIKTKRRASLYRNNIVFYKITPFGSRGQVSPRCKIFCSLYTDIPSRVFVLLETLYENVTRKQLRPTFYSALGRYGIQSMSALGRFYCNYPTLVTNNSKYTHYIKRGGVVP